MKNKIFNFLFLEKSVISLQIIKYKSIKIVTEKELIIKLFKNYYIKKNLILKLGIDTTSKDIHLGHLILFNKIKQIEKINFKIIIIIGTYTSSIGDPTNQNLSRKNYKKKFILINIRYFLFQIKNFLKLKFSRIYFNNEWLEHILLEDIKLLLINANIFKILNRKDFKNRYINKNINLYEIMYSLFQSYDSIFINCDFELGGIDQELNFLFTRKFQKLFKIKIQNLILLNLLIGLDGNKKMSKSYDNYISIRENLNIFLNKLLNINDELFKHFFLKISFLRKKILKKNKIISKINLFIEIIKILYNKKLLNYFFLNKHKNSENFWPKNLIFYKIKINYIFINNLIKILKIYDTTNKIIFYIKQKKIKINNCIINNPNLILFKGKYIFYKKFPMFYLEIF